MSQTKHTYSEVIRGNNGTGLDCYSFDTFWRNPVSCRAICPDGKTRRVRLNQAPDTFFSWSGRVTIGGKTRKCFVSADDNGTWHAHLSQ
jgi:hypothetical protein